MTYKLIALDLDGTLKSSDNIILDKTREILIELALKGVTIVLASGRPTPGLFAEAKELKFDQHSGYLLSFNGARVVNYNTNEVVYQKTFGSDVVKDIYDRAKQYNLAVMTYQGDKVVTEDDFDEYVQVESNINKMDIYHVDDFKGYVDFDVNKLLLTGKPEYIASIVDEFKEPYGDSLSIYRSAPFFIEVMAQGIDKAASLDALVKSLGYTSKEVIAFGDGYNDLSMIEYAGMGVSMANGVDEVKQRANYITDSNDEDGIYNCLKMLMDKGEL